MYVLSFTVLVHYRSKDQNLGFEGGPPLFKEYNLFYLKTQFLPIYRT